MEVFHTAFLYPDRIRIWIFDYFFIIFLERAQFLGWDPWTRKGSWEGRSSFFVSPVEPSIDVLRCL